MKNPVDTIWYLVDEFTENPQHVFIDDKAIEDLAVYLKDKITKDNTGFWGFPDIPLAKEPADHLNCDFATINNNVRCILYELIANSVNYQYWVGKPNIRTNNSGATQMYELLEISFKEV